MVSSVLKEHFIARLLRRAVHYSGSGMATFALDLAIVFLIANVFGRPYESAVAIGFIVGMSTNYLVAYRFVYRGTKRHIFLGYLIFAGLAVGGLAIIIPSVTFLIETFALNLFVARIIVGTLVGIVSFLINTFFNFKLV